MSENTVAKEFATLSKMADGEKQLRILKYQTAVSQKI